MLSQTDEGWNFCAVSPKVLEVFRWVRLAFFFGYLSIYNKNVEVNQVFIYIKSVYHSVTVIITPWTGRGQGTGEEFQSFIGAWSQLLLRAPCAHPHVHVRMWVTGVPLCDAKTSLSTLCDEHLHQEHWYFCFLKFHKNWLLLWSEAILNFLSKYKFFHISIALVFKLNHTFVFCKQQEEYDNEVENGEKTPKHYSSCHFPYCRSTFCSIHLIEVFCILASMVLQLFSQRV